MLPVGLATGGASAALLGLDLPMLEAVLLVTTLSLRYDVTQPLRAGIVTELSPKRGLALGLIVFTLFTGFGFGSLVVVWALGLGIVGASMLFRLVELLEGLLAVPLFRSEIRRTPTAAGFPTATSR